MRSFIRIKNDRDYYVGSDPIIGSIETSVDQLAKVFGPPDVSGKFASFSLMFDDSQPVFIMNHHNETTWYVIGARRELFGRVNEIVNG